MIMASDKFNNFPSRLDLCPKLTPILMTPRTHLFVQALIFWNNYTPKQIMEQSRQPGTRYKKSPAHVTSSYFWVWCFMLGTLANSRFIQVKYPRCKHPVLSVRHSPTVSLFKLLLKT